VSGTRYLPVWVQRGIADKRVQYRVLPLADGLAATSDIPLTKADTARTDEVRLELTTHIAKPKSVVTPLKADDPFLGARASRPPPALAESGE